MRYTVLWTPAAEQDLATLWLAAPDRAAVTAASSEIDRVLAIDPDKQGAATFDTVRTLVVEPLGVDFEVIAPDRLVHVLTVWDTAGPPTP